MAVGETDFPVLLFGAAAAFLRSRIEIAQIGIMSELTDQMQAECSDAIHKRPFGVIPIGSQRLHVGGEQRPIIVKMRDIPIYSAGVGISAREVGRIRGLAPGQMIGCPLVHINHGELGKFQPLFWPIVAGGIEVVQAVSLFTAF